MSAENREIKAGVHINGGHLQILRTMLKPKDEQETSIIFSNLDEISCFCKIGPDLTQKQWSYNHI
ncbi:MAG: hypothetical protein Tsb009_27590 [Planctomycetaceae bacterium]